MTGHTGAQKRRPTRTVAVLLAALLPVAVTVGVYVFGRTHTPDYTKGLFGEHGVAVVDLKARLGSALMALAVVQLLLGLWMYRRLPGAGAAPHRVPPTHRLIGLIAFLLSLPIAYQCITAYGVDFTNSRVAVHSIAGCVLYGVFVAKVLVVRSRRLPGWALPAVGGALVTAIALLWYTAALWFFVGSAPGF
ncbi:hypothetical protein J2Z21_006180 [Streptomyces griseochromogenes]|uniref:Cytochrome b561 domain-containing protein n=1 Tax=Streptomyces griseochromogenes TaxID=68214 RepID=A0A1B1AS53_9ACTN|nr:DUF6529 family protein [Streptomyces griseochromogenes]ANP49386.1 hypothetical protein AVL59_07055 [Streptomyces griseochromogenes]MBP2053189.1 hypothetical protein [Streptomyces griseochromogenes]